MRVEFINPFISSLLNVLSTMAQVELTPGKPRLKKDDKAKGDISGIMGMMSTQAKGSFALTFDESLALAIMQNMLGEKPAKIDAEVIDMVGEITNMVTGGAKRILAEKGFDFDMSTPIVVSGKDHTITHKSEGPKLLLPLTSPFGNASIEICFDG
ncbi:chemotaxis protein CheX [Moritella sp.]|uniref:chemotaxis protein CheX n=1 Tax=Moritella sp. TaxID=78556 RepID=UPI001DDE1288|nr:chemotaxis protein CheX [Moritella sp.]MCJ8350869.1 chemotaxis protein CheX [Moritella sp.]NQZ40443.1 chemotaxis protein CheX [Moritella sp.]